VQRLSGKSEAPEQLEGKVCVVTGGGAGIGRALVKTLGQVGARVAWCGRQQTTLEETQAFANMEGGLFDVVDVREPTQVAKFLANVRESLGEIDILVNNAAVMYLGPLHETSVDDLREMVETNVVGPLMFIRGVIGGMRGRGGQILNMSSISARSVGPGSVVYSATKTALDVISEGLRIECAGTGIRVMSMQLGAVATDLNDKIHHAGMRRFLKARERTYRPLLPTAVASEVIRMLRTPRSALMASVFLVPASQPN
jgi:NADP-dependent 3-hydroxy acid dehydrogenase YdfG